MGNLDLNNNDIINVADLHAETISSPNSPDVYANGQRLVLAAQPNATPNSAAGKAAPVPVTDSVIQIGPSTYARGGVVFYGNDATGNALAKAGAIASMGQYGPLPHEPGSNGPPGPAVNCSDFQPSGNGLQDSNYGFKISKHFTLQQLIVGSNLIVGQQGRTAVQIACALKALATNILDPIYDHQPFIINSGFRTLANNSSTAGASKTSDHLIGCAADITVQHGADGPNLDLYKWIIKSGLPFSQIIAYQNSSSGQYSQWIHVAFNGAHPSGGFRCAYKPQGGTYSAGGNSGENLPAILKP